MRRSAERGGGLTHLYLSRASLMTDIASRAWDCTPLRRLLSTSWARKASTFACSSRQTWRKESDWAGAAAGGSLTPPFAAGETPLARWWCGITAAGCVREGLISCYDRKSAAMDTA